MPANDKEACEREIVILVGPPQSGKTTAAGFLRSIGYKVISAAAVVERLTQQLSSGRDRRTLIYRGEIMLREKGAQWFGEKLLAEATGHERIVFDGIRPLKTIEYIVNAEPHTIILYIKACDKIRRERYQRSKGGSDMSYDDILQSEVELTARGVERLAEVVSNNGSHEDFIQSIERVVRGGPRQY